MYNINKSNEQNIAAKTGLGQIHFSAVAPQEFHETHLSEKNVTDFSTAI